MVLLKDAIKNLELLKMEKLTHNINAYMRYVKDNNSKLSAAQITAFKLMNKLLEELEKCDKEIDALITNAKNIITKDNYMNQDLIIKNKNELFKKIIVCERTIFDKLYSNSDSYHKIIFRMLKDLKLHLSEYTTEEDNFLNKIPLGNFNGVNLCDFLNYVDVSFGIYVSQENHNFRYEIKSYIKYDYEKEIELFFNDQRN